MILEHLTESSRQIIAAAPPGHGLSLTWRPQPGGTSQYSSGGSGTVLYGLRLSRTGNQITAFESENGSQWTETGTVTLPMGFQLLHRPCGDQPQQLGADDERRTPANPGCFTGQRSPTMDSRYPRVGVGERDQFLAAVRVDPNLHQQATGNGVLLHCCVQWMPVDAADLHTDEVDVERVCGPAPGASLP